MLLSSQDKSTLDISLLLNAHDEWPFIDKTLSSIYLDLKVARENHLRVELVIVLDKSTNKFYSYVCQLLENLGIRAKLLRVNYGSLGASRNFGVKNSLGQYICVADADDLTSSNCLMQMYKTIKEYEGKGEDVAVFPEFVWNFGANRFVTRKLNSDFYQLKDWAYLHPFCSKLMVKRSLFQMRGYQSFDNNSPFSYEDWEFNAFLLSKGVKLVIAPNTILFYRQRPNSMMKNSSKKATPKLDVLSPQIFMTTAEDERASKSNLKVDLNVLNKLAKEAQKVENQIYLLRSASQIYPQFVSIPKKNWTDYLKHVFGLTGSVTFDSVFFIKDQDIRYECSYSLLINKLKNINGLKLVIGLGIENKERFYNLMTLNCVVVLDFSNFFGWMRFENKKNLLQCVAMSICKNKGLVFISKDFDNILDIEALESIYTVVRNLIDVSTINGSTCAYYDSDYLKKISTYLTSDKFIGTRILSSNDIPTQLLALPRIKRKDFSLFSAIVNFSKRNSLLFKMAKSLYIAYYNFRNNR